MNRKEYFKSTEKSFWKKTVGREWTHLGIRGWLLKISVVIYFIQFIYFNLDWRAPFMEGFIFYIMIVMGYIFLSKDNKNYFYLQVSENTIEVFKNNIIQQKITVSNLVKIYIFDREVNDSILSKKVFIKNSFKWTGVNFQWIENDEGKKDVGSVNFYLDGDEVIKLKKFINANDLLKNKLSIV